MRLQLRPYQQECLQRAIKHNTIVSLDTGLGKTLIAARLIEHYLHKHPDKKVAFLVPTRPLVEQQSRYCMEHCCVFGSQPMIQRLVGQDQAGWQLSDWENCVRQSHILIGTPAVFQQAFLTGKFLEISRFSLLVFDECHNATGNSPMAAIMRDCVARCIHERLPSPRILGLTASFINGSIRNPEKKRRDLEGLLQSTIFAPEVAARITPERFITVKYTVQNIDDEKQVVQDLVQKALVDVNVKEVKKVISRCVHVFEELGTDALLLYVEKIIIQQMKEKASSLASLGDDRSVSCAQEINNALPAIQHQVKELYHHLKGDSLLKKSDKSTKLERLEELITELFTNNEKGYRGIIFVEQVALVSSLALQLNQSFRGVLKCGAVAGNGYQTENDRQEQLDRFKCGDIQILVATAALEEGIDVSDCAFVIRFSIMRTTKAHIQGAGRARHPNAMIFYFENDVFLEIQKESQMSSVAKNESISLKEEAFLASVRTMNITIEHRHPFPFTSSRDGSGEVNVFNCKQIFFQYCSIVLCASISPEEHLYEFTTMDDGTRLLSRIRYPTSRGWMYVDVTECKEFWSGINMDIIFNSERSKSKTQHDKHEMQFVYVVVIKLRMGNLLDIHNMPNNLNFTEVRENCPLEVSSANEFVIKNNIFQSYARHEVPIVDREVYTRSIPCSVSTISIDSYEKNG